MGHKKTKQADFRLSSTQLSQKKDHSSKPLHKYETGSGQIVVLCHGAASHSGQWKALIKELAQDYRVIALINMAIASLRFGLKIDQCLFKIKQHLLSVF